MRNRFSSPLSGILVILIVMLFGSIVYGQVREGVLHSFDDADGANPQAALTFDSAGNLYGTTLKGGADSCGTAFGMSPKKGGGWREGTLYSFNGTDGCAPSAALIFDAAGNLYSTTSAGGAYNCGTVFTLRPKAGGGWRQVVLHSFNDDGMDGCSPLAGLIFDAAGNLYGTTNKGGIYGHGTVFGLMPKPGGGWREGVLHSFNADNGDGVGPQANLVQDAAGNLYGTTTYGGAYGYGAVFELTPQSGGNSIEEVLYSFQHDGTEGTNPYGGLVFDPAGNLYGTTVMGGGYFRCGAVFELTPQAGGGWVEEIVHRFKHNFKDGCGPEASVIFDSAGNLYGTTIYGGDYGYGSVFGLAPRASGGWTEITLHSFDGSGADGYYPVDGLILDATGNVYGTTAVGGSNKYYGTVFGVKP